MAKQVSHTKPYVDFVDLGKSPKAKRALALMKKRIFPRNGKFNFYTQFTWEQHEGMMVERFKLRGKDLYLFLGHSKHWANSPF